MRKIAKLRICFGPLLIVGFTAGLRQILEWGLLFIKRLCYNGEDKYKQKGFTIIGGFVCSYFWSATPAQWFMSMSINRQQYRDSVQSYAGFLRNEYWRWSLLRMMTKRLSNWRFWWSMKFTRSIWLRDCRSQDDTEGSAFDERHPYKTYPAYAYRSICAWSIGVESDKYRIMLKPGF